MLESKKIIASIEARMTSSRLPGKVLMPAIEKITMLEFMINRLKMSKKIDDIIIATTTNESDNSIINLCKKNKIKFFRGSEDDVLERVYECHKEFKSDVVVELTGDCPLIDPKIVDDVINYYLNNSFDYVSNSHVRSFPMGLDVEVFSFELLKQINTKTQDPFDREHVSTYFYTSGLYDCGEIIANKKLYWPDLRLTLDDNGDYLFLKKIIKNF